MRAAYLWKSTRSSTASRTCPSAPSQFGGIFDYDQKHDRLVEVNRELEDPNVWNKPEYAQSLGRERATLAQIVETIDDLTGSLADSRDLLEMAAEENDEGAVNDIVAEVERLREILEKLEFRRMFSHEMDPNNCYLDIQAGSGGTEAQDWANILLRMYLRWAEQRGWPTKVMDTSYAEEAGLKSVTFEVAGPFAYGTLSVEAGTHRLVRISPFDNQGRRQTSFAAVEVVPLIESDDSIEIPESEIKVDVFRSSGPGGQSVNTTDSAVRMTHLPTGIVVSMQNEKSQIQNRAAAMRVLQNRLLLLQKEQEAAKKKELAGNITASWGDQMRSYFLYGQQLVKDLRTGQESGNPAAVFDGDLDDFISAGIRWRKRKDED